MNRFKEASPDISIVVPLFNEGGNLPPLLAALDLALNGVGRTYEVILVNDGSSDATAERLDEIGDPRVRVVHFRRNFGQTAALMAGFNTARGAVIIAMDGDMQNDPVDIPRLLAKLDEGYDVVSGWRTASPGRGFSTQSPQQSGELAYLDSFRRPSSRLRLHLEGVSSLSTT